MSDRLDQLQHSRLQRCLRMRICILRVHHYVSVYLCDGACDNRQAALCCEAPHQAHQHQHEHNACSKPGRQYSCIVMHGAMSMSSHKTIGFGTRSAQRQMVARLA